MTDRKSNYMHVFSGGKYYPFEPRVEEVNVEDIAHSLATKARWNGHTRFPVWVAQHSVYTALCDVPGANSYQDRLERLMHDAPEYVVGDLIRPLKYSPEFSLPFKKVEDLNEKIIAEAIDLSFPHKPHVKIADEMVTTAEHQQVVNRDENVVFDNMMHDDSNCAPFEIEEWTWRQAKAAFLALYDALSLAVSVGLGHEEVPVTDDIDVLKALQVPSDEDLRASKG